MRIAIGTIEVPADELADVRAIDADCRRDHIHAMLYRAAADRWHECVKSAREELREREIQNRQHEIDQHQRRLRELGAEPTTTE